VLGATALLYGPNHTTWSHAAYSAFELLGDVRATLVQVTHNSMLRAGKFLESSIAKCCGKVS